MDATILYLDDDNVTAKVVMKTLVDAGYRVVFANNGKEGLHEFNRQVFDAIVCDYEMPGMDGLAFLHQIEEMGDIPAFVFLTGKGSEPVAVRAMKSGASDYVVKDEEGQYLQTLPYIIERARNKKSTEESHRQALESLRESEQRYRDIFETNPAKQFIVNPKNGSFYDCNNAAAEFYGYSKEEFLTKKIFDITRLSDTDVHEKIGLITSRKELRHNVQHRLKSGESRNVDVYTGPLTIAGKTYIHAIVQDVTDLVAAQKQQSASEAKFRQIFERTHDGLCILGADGIVEEWNHGAQQITEVTSEQAIGKHISEILFHEYAGLTNEDLRDGFEEDLAKVFERSSEYIDRKSDILLAPDGSVRYVDMSIFPIDMPDAPRVCVIIHNVTGQIHSQKEITAREQKFRTLFDSIADAVFITEQKTGVLIEVNTAACMLYKHTHNEMIGMNVLELTAEPEMTKQALRTPDEYIALRYHKRKTGEIFPAEITTSAVRMNNRDVIVCTVRDITQRISLQQELERSVALMEVVNDTVVDAILVTDSDDNILSFNKRFIQTWGIPQEDTFNPAYVEQLDAIFQNPPEVERISASLLRVQKAQTDAYGIVEIMPAQEYEVHASPFFVRDRAAGTVWSFRNLTQRRHAEEQLQVSQARLRAIFDNAAVGIALLNRHGKFVQFNEQLAVMLGYTDNELKLLHKHEISYGDDREFAKVRIAKLFENGLEGYRIEKRFVRKDGDIFWADLSVKPIINQAGKVEAAISVIADISDKKRFENELQHTNRNLQSRNEELNAFAHSVAHDLKNPVSVIKGLAELLEEDLYAYEPDELYEVISRIKSAGDSMESIIDSLMLLSRVRDENIEIEAIDMQAVLMNALQQLQQTIDDNNARIDIPETLPNSYGYAPWVQLVWTNYISNAIKYSGESPRVHISAEKHTDSEITYYVEDSGPGISIDEIDKLFAPYQRLTKTKTGHGLGLSIVKRIVERLRGRVGISNSESGGAIFYFTLPTGGSHE